MISPSTRTPANAGESPHRAACMICALQPFCYPHNLPPRLMDLVPLVRAQRRRLARGESLFRAGDLQQAIYAVKAGFLMSRVPLDDGRMQVSEFAIVGDVLGYDAMGDGFHHSDAIALDACEVCEIPVTKFERLLEHAESAAAATRLLGFQVQRVTGHAAALAALTARQRVAGFLIDFAQRWEARGFSPNEFVLPMGRADLGSYLGLTAETVTRELSLLRAGGITASAGKHLQILDMARLEAMREQPEKPAASRLHSPTHARHR